MKIIKIASLKLENFKSHKNRVFDFGGNSATIYGDNASGKTSVFDGLTWLLFGKTSTGNSDNELLKPVDLSGQVADHAAITAVEAELDTVEDGIPGKITLRKELQEVWTSRRGSSQQVYDGNTCAYYIDGVPMKKNEYDRRVGQIIDEDKFRLLTSVYYFAETIPWKERRAVLSELCGSVSDLSLMASDERFTELLTKIGALTLDDYRKLLAARKKSACADRDTIPARIAEQEQVVATLCAVDYEAVKTELDAQEAAIRSLQEKKNSIANTSEIEKLKARIEVLSADSCRLDAENRAFRAEQQKAAPDISALEHRSRMLHDDLINAERDIKNSEDTKARVEKQLSELRKRWEEADALTFNENECCPTCGQKLPKIRLEAAKTEFERNKKKIIADIELSAGEAKNTISVADSAISDFKKKSEDLRAEISKNDEEMRSAKEVAASVTVCDMDGYASKKAEIEAEGKAVSTELSSLMKESDGAKKAVELKLSDARLKYKELSDALGKKASLEFAEKRIEELRAQQKRAAQDLEEIDKDLWLIEEFIRFKAKAVESTVNGHFRLATFRLFRNLVNTGLEECCDAVHDGVPYAALNNGMRINIGLDIIRTLSDHYGVRVPLFIDNAESVTELEDAGTQMIRLVVSAQDKTLRVE